MKRYGLPPLRLDQLEAVSGVAVGLLRDDGALVESNDAFREAWCRGVAPSSSWAACFVNPEFGALLERARAAPASEEWTLVYDGVIHVGPPDAISRAMRASVLVARGHLLVLAQPDIPDYERLSREALELHEGLSEAHRKQARDMAKLRATEAELREALEQVKTLRGLLPVCSSCRRVKSDEGLWEQLERYVERHSLAEFSHGICEDCLKREMDALGPDPGAQG